MAGFRQASIIHDLASRDQVWFWYGVMSKQYPDWLDPRKAAEGRRTFAGTMPLERMPRLAPLLASADGEAAFTASFTFDKQARVTIRIEVDAGLPLICQRSLEPYIEKVSRRSLLGVVEDLAEEGLMPENYEPVLAQQGKLALLELVEDELLLGLPQVPRNPELDDITLSSGSPEIPAQAESQFRQPFANLAEQLKNLELKKK